MSDPEHMLEMFTRRVREGLGHSVTIFSCGPEEKIVAMTPFRDCIVIATTARVMIYGPDNTIRTLAALP